MVREPGKRLRHRDWHRHRTDDRLEALRRLWRYGHGIVQVTEKVIHGRQLYAAYPDALAVGAGFRGTLW
ncbi:hypothetical protein GCM10009712_36940 [Pseudarthrobacter sulfonivorans]